MKKKSKSKIICFARFGFCVAFRWMLPVFLVVMDFLKALPAEQIAIAAQASYGGIFITNCAPG